MTKSDQRYIGNYLGYSLQSAFQPIFSLAHKRAVGYEALLRAYDASNRSVPPSDMFMDRTAGESLVKLDRLSRYLHIKNFPCLHDDLNWLFLNISPQIITLGQSYGSFFKDMLSVTGFPPNRVVVEIVEYPISNNGPLEETIEYYKDIGCLIAIDDFGAGHSNFERIWSMNPDIVKLDRSMIVSAANQQKIRRLLPEIVSLLHQAGSLVLIEGIENQEQAMIAMESDVDFVQGYYFARPFTDYEAVSEAAPDFDGLFQKFKETKSRFKEEWKSVHTRFDARFRAAAEEIRLGKTIGDACRTLTSDSSTIRCYLLQPDGIQIGSTIVSQRPDDETDNRFRPIQDADSADWFRRHYLTNAVSHPRQLQITQPYLSITGAHMCITLSMMFATNKGNRVLCADLSWA